VPGHTSHGKQAGEGAEQDQLAELAYEDLARPNWRSTDVILDDVLLTCDVNSTRSGLIAVVIGHAGDELRYRLLL